VLIASSYVSDCGAIGNSPTQRKRDHLFYSTDPIYALSKMDSLQVISKTRVVPKKPNDESVFGEKDLEGGCYHRISHLSSSTHTKMVFGLFLPSAYNKATQPLPVLFWLSGLTCDDTNFAIKAGPKAFAAAESRVSGDISSL
jgi:predicted peptidase